jgi:muramoyltetrapeptide carboxypeptidase
MIKPPRLKEGSLIGLAAPASSPNDPSSLQRGQRTLQQLGFRVKLGRHLLDSRGYLAGPDEARAEDLNELFADPEVEAVFSIRGGYGAARLLPLVDLTLLADHPKVFLGYSDITALQLAIHREIGLVTFYGPMVTTDMAGDFSGEDRDRLLQVITQARPPKPIDTAAGGEDPLVVRPGRAEGVLVGGCLSVLVSQLGTPYMPDLDGAILFLEDIGEEPYRLDRYLTQLRLSGKLDRVAGLALGEFVDCEPRKERSSFPTSLRLQEVFQDLLGDIGVPVLAGLGFGHGQRKATLPLGVRAAIDTTKGLLEILEPAVL